MKEEIHPDLFGGETKVFEPSGSGPYKDFRDSNNYRKAIIEDVNCGACVNFKRSGRWFKCLLQGDSNCESSDIRKGYVCDSWEQK